MYTGQSIKALRKRAGLTQHEFSEAVGLTREHLSKMEAGKVAISKATQIMLGDYERQFVHNATPSDVHNAQAKAPSGEGQGALNNVESAWSRIDKAVQAATEAAQAATRLADLIESRLQIHEERIGASETMVQALQEFVTVRFAAIEKTTRQEVGAALGNTVIEIAKLKKKGIQIASST